MSGSRVFAQFAKSILKLVKWKAITSIRGIQAAKQTLKIAKCCANHATGGSLEGNRKRQKPRLYHNGELLCDPPFFLLAPPRVPDRVCRHNTREIRSPWRRDHQRSGASGGSRVYGSPCPGRRVKRGRLHFILSTCISSAASSPSCIFLSSIIPSAYAIASSVQS